MPDPAARAALIEAMAQALAPRLYGGAEYVLTNADKRRAIAALAAIEAHNGGCVVVPREAMDAMKAAYPERWGVPAYGLGHEFRILAAASPYAPPQQEDKA